METSYDLANVRRASVINGWRIDEADHGFDAVLPDRNIRFPFYTRESAFDFLAECLGLVKPGRTLLISPEFGEEQRDRPNYAPIFHRSRFEIREMPDRGRHQIFHLERMYMPTGATRDVFQSRIRWGLEPARFADLAHAATSVVAMIAEYEKAVAENNRQEQREFFEELFRPFPDHLRSAA